MSAILSNVGASPYIARTGNQVFGVPPRVYNIEDAIARLEGGDDISRLVIEDTAANIASGFDTLKGWVGDKILKGIRVTDDAEVTLSLADLQGSRAEVNTVLKRLKKADVAISDNATSFMSSYEDSEGNTRTGMDDLKLYQRRIDRMELGTTPTTTYQATDEIDLTGVADGDTLVITLDDEAYTFTYDGSDWADTTEDGDGNPATALAAGFTITIDISEPSETSILVEKRGAEFTLNGVEATLGGADPMSGSAADATALAVSDFEAEDALDMSGLAADDTIEVTIDGTAYTFTYDGSDWADTTVDGDGDPATALAAGFTVTIDSSDASETGVSVSREGTEGFTISIAGAVADPAGTPAGSGDIQAEPNESTYEPNLLSLTTDEYKAAKKVLSRLENALVEVKLDGSYGNYTIKAGKNGAISAKSSDLSTFKGTANFLRFLGTDADSDSDDERVFATSGNSRLDAILEVGKRNLWSPSAIQNGLLRVNSSAENDSADDVQQLSQSVVALDETLNSNTPIALTYGFHTAETGAQLTGEDRYFFEAMDERQKAVVRDAFTYLSSLINVTFTEDTGEDFDAETTTFQFGTNEQESSAGYAYMPQAATSLTTKIMLANNVTSNDFDMLTDDADPDDGAYTIEEGDLSTLRASYGWTTLIHEIGHALGLKHPGNYNAGGGGADTPYLPKTLDSRQWTVMSYSGAPAATLTDGTPALSQNSQTYMVYDLAALQFLYGRSTATDDLDSFQTTDFSSDWSGFQTVWAPDGITFDLGDRENDVIVDMRPGTYSSVSRFNDSGLAFGSTYGEVTTGSGDDAIYAGLYTASVEGGDGDDTVYLAGDAADYGLEEEEVADDGSIGATEISEVTRSVDGEDITISLSNIEKIKFYDNTRVSGLHSIDNLA
jgi:hypothetical protein